MHNLTIQQIEEQTLNANAVKELILLKLRENGVITEQQEREYADRWQVVTTKGAWYKRWLQLFKKSDEYFFIYVKFE